MCSCSLSFSWPPISTLEAASTSNFLTADITFSSYSSKEIGLLCFFISSSFSVIRVNVDIKIKSKERIGVVVVVVFFISKIPGGYAIYSRNARVLEMQNFTQAYMNGWT